MTLREYMRATGMTQPQAAANLGVPYRTLVGWLCYGKTPSPRTQTLIERQTGGAVTPADWFAESVGGGR